MRPRLRIAVILSALAVLGSALAVLGAVKIFGPEIAGLLEAGTRRLPDARPEIQTHLYALERTKIDYVDKTERTGGALESMGDDLLVVTSEGRIVLVRQDGEVEHLAGRVPMNVSGWESTESFGGNKKKQPFRVADILVKEMTPGRSELFVSHHYFAEECVRFRLSSTTLLVDSPPPPPPPPAAREEEIRSPCRRRGGRYSTQNLV